MNTAAIAPMMDSRPLPIAENIEPYKDNGSKPRIVTKRIAYHDLQCDWWQVTSWLIENEEKVEFRWGTYSTAHCP